MHINNIYNLFNLLFSNEKKIMEMVMMIMRMKRSTICEEKFILKIVLSHQKFYTYNHKAKINETN